MAEQLVHPGPAAVKLHNQAASRNTANHIWKGTWRGLHPVGSLQRNSVWLSLRFLELERLLDGAGQLKSLATGDLSKNVSEMGSYGTELQAIRVRQWQIV
jgi:hypothetical protein